MSCLECCSRVKCLVLLLRDSPSSSPCAWQALLCPRGGTRVAVMRIREVTEGTVTVTVTATVTETETETATVTVTVTVRHATAEGRMRGTLQSKGGILFIFLMRKSYTIHPPKSTVYLHSRRAPRVLAIWPATSMHAPHLSAHACVCAWYPQHCRPIWQSAGHRLRPLCQSSRHWVRRVVGISSGRMTRRSVCQRLAPSRPAASSSEGDICCRAAR